jgi:hypothetical protein
MTICGYTLTRYSILLLTAPRFVQVLDRSNTLSSPIVLSWGHTLERECRLALWKHSAPWKHGSVKGGKVERPFHLGEEHTELTLCLSSVHLCSSAGDTMHTSLKANSSDMVEGKTERLASESRKTPRLCKRAHLVVCSFNKQSVYKQGTLYFTSVQPTIVSGSPSNKMARIVYNNALDIKLRTCDIEDVMDTFVPIGDAPNIVGQLYDPETETLQQKWLIGFCDSHKADYFHQNYRTWFENAEIDPRFKFKLTLGQCKTKPKDNVKTAGRGRGRGRGRGAATRGRGK